MYFLCNLCLIFFGKHSLLPSGYAPQADTQTATSYGSAAMSDTEISSLFGIYLVNKDLAAPDDIVQALDRQRELQAPLGTLALRRRYLTMKQVFTTLNLQAQTGRRFGDIAVDLGFLTRDQLQELLIMQALERPKLGHLLVEMGVFDESTMQSHHDDYIRQLEYGPDREAAAV
jgi:hypothetical protein